MFSNKKNVAFSLLMMLLFALSSCEEIPKSWGIEQFEKETGLKEEAYKIETFKTSGDQLCIITTITPTARQSLENRFTFISNEALLKELRAPNAPSYPVFEPYNIDSVRDDCVYYLHTYTNESKTIATNYTVFILSKKTNEFIFCEMFAE